MSNINIKSVFVAAALAVGTLGAVSIASTAPAEAHGYGGGHGYRYGHPYSWGGHYGDSCWKWSYTWGRSVYVC